MVFLRRHFIKALCSHGDAAPVPKSRLAPDLYCILLAPRRVGLL